MSLTYEHEMNFLCLGMNIFFLLHYDLHLLKVLNTKWCSPHYACIMWKETIERINGPKKWRCIIFLDVFPMFFKFWLQNYFDMWFDNLIKYITSLLYSVCSMILTHLYLYKNVFNDMNIHLSKERKKKPKHLKPTYLWNYLTKMKQTIKLFQNAVMQKTNDQIMFEEVYLWIMLSLKFTFDIF
jgi:hypothetical protein